MRFIAMSRTSSILIKRNLGVYVNSFCEFRPYVHRQRKGVYNGEVYSLPVNLFTLIQFFKTTLTPQTAHEVSYKNIIQPNNFEEQALAFIGEKLYIAFFKGYTKKQWGCLIQKNYQLPF